jgi:hypothetical protein
LGGSCVEQRALFESSPHALDNFPTVVTARGITANLYHGLERQAQGGGSLCLLTTGSAEFQSTAMRERALEPPPDVCLPGAAYRLASATIFSYRQLKKGSLWTRAGFPTLAAKPRHPRPASDTFKILCPKCAIVDEWN